MINLFLCQQLVIRRVLAAEFGNNSNALRRNLAADLPEDEPFSVGIPTRIISHEISTELGLLDPDEVNIVVNAIISFEGMTVRLENICIEKTDNRFIIPPEAINDFLKIAENTAESLDFAVKALEYSSKTKI